MLLLRPSPNSRLHLCCTAPHSVFTISETKQYDHSLPDTIFPVDGGYSSSASKSDDGIDSTKAQDSYLKDIESHAEQDEQRLRFGEVRIRTYTVTLGDNPSVSRGPPVTLDWDHNASESYDVDYLESLNLSSCAKAAKCKRIPESQREALLLSRGYTSECLAKTLKEIEEIKDERKKSINHVKQYREMVQARNLAHRRQKELEKLTSSKNQLPLFGGNRLPSSGRIEI